MTPQQPKGDGMPKFRIVRRGYASKLKEIEPYITALEAERDELRTEVTKLVEFISGFHPPTPVVDLQKAMDWFNLESSRDSWKARAERYETALREIAKFWFDPTDDKRGVCGCCAGGLMFKPEQKYMEHHEKDCPFDIAKAALEGEK